MKLVWDYTESDGATYSSTISFPLEYSSKDDLIYFVLEKAKQAKSEDKWYVDLFKENDYWSVEECEDIENNLFTLEEWFEKRKLI